MRVFRGYVNGEASIRSMMGREFLVLPVVAFQVGVWHGMNQETPEYTPERTLKSLPLAWNGRPVVADHPVDDNGQAVSAGSPEILSNTYMGWVFNAHVKDKTLRVEAWIDMQTPAAMSENVSILLDKIEQREPIEVSIGAFVKLEKIKGFYQGKSYGAVWKEIWPDHLAFLSSGEGACSNKDGCGVCFDAMSANDGGALATAEVSAETMTRLKAMRRRSDLVQTETAGKPSMKTFLANGLFDRDVRTMLQNFLNGQFVAPYVIALSDDRVVFEAIELDEFGDMVGVQIYVANYEIDADNNVSLTSTAEPAWLAIAPMPFKTSLPVTEDEKGDVTMADNKAKEVVEPKQEATCDCTEPPTFGSLADVTAYLGKDHAVSREIAELETLREERRKELIEYIGEDAGEDADLAKCSMSWLSTTAKIVKRARERAEAEKAEAYKATKPANYAGSAGSASQPARRPQVPAPKKVFETAS